MAPIYVKKNEQHLKIVSPQKGSKVITMPGSKPKMQCSKSMNASGVSDIVNFYSKLEDSPRNSNLRKSSVPSREKKNEPEEGNYINGI